MDRNLNYEQWKRHKRKHGEGGVRCKDVEEKEEDKKNLRDGERD